MVAALAVLPSASAQTPPDAPLGVFSAETGVVLLDVVVRDKKGQSLRDLSAAQVEVYEDGVRQAVTSFRRVEAPRRLAPATGEPLAVASAELPAPPQLSLCTLLFDQLGPQGRAIARRAALEFLDLPPRPGQYIAVFAVANRLELVQQFTADRDALRRAVEVAAAQQGPAMSVATEREQQLAKREGELVTDLEGLAATQGEGGLQSAQAAAAGQEAAMLRMAMDAIRLTDRLQRQQQGEASLFALIGLARQQQRLAGRKTIVYFSEGLRSTSTLEETFQSAISEANRSNVSVYAVDARGLTTGSGYGATRDMTQRALEAVRRQMTSRGNVAVTREEAFAGETIEESLRANTQDTLGDLAQGTGGFLIANTNDLKTGLERMADDSSVYYEVVYSPQNLSFDGGFRRVEVKVARPGVSVQARSGYFALPPGEGSVTFPYELPLLAALKADPPPEDFVYRAAAFHFDPGATSLHTVALEVPVHRLEFRREGSGFHAHFRIMAVLRSPARGIVEKHVQDFPVEVPDSRYDALRRGSIFFTRSFRLEPGRYRLETVVADEIGKKRSVRKSVFQVASAPSRLALSSLTLIRKTEAVAEGALETDDPFRFDRIRLVPYVGEPTIARGEEVSLFMTAFTGAGDEPAPELLLEFLEDGAVVRRSSPALPPPDEKGRIPYLATISSAGFEPGRVEVRATLRRGPLSFDESAFFIVADPPRQPGT